MRQFIFLFIIISFTLISEENILIGAMEVPPIQSSTMTTNGMMPEIIRASFKEVNYNVEFEFFPMVRLTYMINHGVILAGILSKEGITANKDMIHTELLAHSNLVFFYKKSKFPEGLNINSIKDLNKLKEYKIGIVRGAPQTELLNSYNLDLENVDSSEANFKKLKYNRVDIISTVDIIGYYMLKYIKEDFEEYGCSKSILETKGVIAFSKNYPNYKEISSLLRKGYESARDKGIIYKIFEKYYYNNEIPSNAIIY